MKTRKMPLFRSFALLFAVLALLSACQPQATEAPVVEEVQPTEVAGIATQPPVQAEALPTQISADINLDPALAQDADSLMVSRKMCMPVRLWVSIRKKETWS